MRIVPGIAGIETPVLPCGIRLYLAYRGRSVLASVIGHEPVPAGRELDLTAALARRLGLSGVRARRLELRRAPTASPATAAAAAADSLKA